MKSEEDIRQMLQSLDSFWEGELSRRSKDGKGMWPVDCYWYIYTRDAYLEILEEHTNKRGRS